MEVLKLAGVGKGVVNPSLKLSQMRRVYLQWTKDGLSSLAWHGKAGKCIEWAIHVSVVCMLSIADCEL